MIYGKREGCPSDRHDTRRARKDHGCRCPLAVAICRADQRAYDSGPKGQKRRQREMAKSRRLRRPLIQARTAARERRIGTVLYRTKQGWSAAEIARDLRTSHRQVQRDRATLRERGELVTV